MIFKKRTLLDSQIEVFFSWNEREGKTYSFEYLKDLHRYTDDVMELTNEDILDFLGQVSDNYKTEYSVDSARRTLNALRRFYMARGNGVKMPVGRPPLVEKIEKAKKYRGMGYSMRKIAKLISSDVAWVHKAVNYNPDKLNLFKR